MVGPPACAAGASASDEGRRRHTACASIGGYGSAWSNGQLSKAAAREARASTSFATPAGDVLYVGKAKSLRSRVR